jgi:hypothetical protein
VEEISIQGEYACFTCGYGNHCPVGGFVDMYPLGTAIKPEIMPTLTNQHPDQPDLSDEKRNLLIAAQKIGKVLSKVLDIKKAKQKKFTGINEA